MPGWLTASPGTARAKSVTADSQRARHFAVLYSPPRQRPVLEALLGIENEIAASLRPGLDHQVAHTRLQWWRDECLRCSQGAPLHPLTRQLASLRTPQRLQSLSGLVDVSQWDLARATFGSRAELTGYCERWSAAMIVPLAPEDEPRGLRALGAALRELEMLNELAHEARSGRLRLPLDELDGICVNPESLGRPPWPDALAQTVRSRHESLRSVLAAGCGELETNEPGTPLRGLAVWIALACRASQRAQRAIPGENSSPRFGSVGDAWHAWVIARRAS